MPQQDGRLQLERAAYALYERYAASILAYARLHTPCWEDAEDLTVEVFTAAFEQDNLSWLADKQQFVWLRSVAQHKLVDRYRRSIHVSVMPLEQVVETVQAGETLTPEQIVVRREELERLYKAASTLSLFQQQVLQLRFGEGLRLLRLPYYSTNAKQPYENCVRVPLLSYGRSMSSTRGERNGVMTDTHELTPDEVDEQNQHLMQDLRHMYRTDTQTVEHKGLALAPG